MNDVKVIVLMSTYNGEKYLRQQVDSILNQEQVEVNLKIRDDGSTDNTLKILYEYANDPRVHIESATNVGWRLSFMRMVNTTKYESGCYYAFADQDDVWLPKKLINAVKMLNLDEPMLYHSNVMIMDNDEKLLGKRFPDTFSITSAMPEAFFNGMGTGSTMVFNSQMLALLHEYEVKTPTPHDAYVMALANVLGRVVYDRESYILYRRHLGTATGFGSVHNVEHPTLLMRYRRYRKNPKNMFSERASLILAGYSKKLKRKDKKIFEMLESYQTDWWVKIQLLFRFDIKASGLRKTLQIKFRILLNTL